MKSFKASFLAVIIVPMIGLVSASKKVGCPQAEADLIENAIIKTNGERIPDSYTIVFHPLVPGQSLEDMAHEALSKTDSKVDKDGFLPLINGVLVKMSESQAEALSRRTEVKYVQENARMEFSNAVASWGLDRIDQRDLPLNGLFMKANAPNRGEGTVNYVIDTGILNNHREFLPLGRAFTSAAYDFYTGTGGNNNGIDCNGHGTHVSGIIGGNTVGVAPHTKLVGVRVFGCGRGGNVNDVMRAMQKVANDCPNGTSSEQTPFPGHKCIVNLSLGQSYDIALNDLTTALSNQGIVVTVAAGNERKDACLFSPPSAVGAFTVGATTLTDEKWPRSNYGPAVDVYAPGFFILSADVDDEPTATHFYDFKRGTSMAAPHAAGVAALIYGENLNLSAEEVKAKILGDATEGKISGLEGTNSSNLLLYISESGEDPTKSPTGAPTVGPATRSPTKSPTAGKGSSKSSSKKGSKKSFAQTSTRENVREVTWEAGVGTVDWASDSPMQYLVDAPMSIDHDESGSDESV